jgi:hypothetical protein
MVVGSRKGAADRIRINVTDDYELTYFSRSFGVTPDELRAAVQKVGPTGTQCEQN